MRIKNSVVGAGVLTASLAIGSAAWTAQDAKRAEAQSVSTLDGTYFRRASTTASEDAARAQAIQQATANLTVSARDHWRGLLEELGRPSPRVELRHEAADLVVENGDRVELRSAASGAIEGVEGGWDLDQRVVNNVLVQHIEADALAGDDLQRTLRQTLRYSLNSSAQVLTVETRIEGGDLSSVLTFRVTYSRN